MCKKTCQNSSQLRTCFAVRLPMSMGWPCESHHGHVPRQRSRQLAQDPGASHHPEPVGAEAMPRLHSMTSRQNLSDSFLKRDISQLRNTKITTWAPFKASGKPLKSDKAMVNIFLESFGILSTRPLLRLTACFIQLEVVKVAAPHFQLSTTVSLRRMPWKLLWMHWLLRIFIMSLCLAPALRKCAFSSPLPTFFMSPSKLGHDKRYPKVSQHLGTKGRSTGGCSSAGRFTTSVCLRSCMSAAAAACNTSFATWQKLFKCSSEMLDHVGSIDATISSCQNQSTTKPHAAASPCPRSSWYLWSL